MTSRATVPTRLTSFVGRDDDVAEIGRLLRHARLLTLVGAGGCGKTRLAAHVVAPLAERWVVYWADLAPLPAGSLLPASVAAAAGLAEPQTRDLLDALADHLAGRQIVLVLDNCEHLTHECAAFVEGFLHRCDGLVVLATSREPLGADGEALYAVAPLPVPRGDDVLETNVSVQLFADRARQVRPRFAVTSDNRDAVAAIVCRLDGIPLAIELAAARARMLTPHEILTGLAGGFELLTAAAKTTPVRHRTLRASIEWSYRLLSGEERQLLDTVSVFAGSFSLDAARAVCSERGIVDMLAGLVDRSLVEVDLDGGSARYRLLETIRAYASERLAEAGRAESVQDLHLDYWLSVAERAEVALQGSPDQVAWLDRLDAELPNLRAAGSWARTTGQYAKEMRLATSLWFFFSYRSHMSDWKRSVVDRLAERGELEPTPRAKLLLCAGWYLFWTGDIGRYLAVAQEALALGQECGDAWVVGRAYFALGWIEYLTGTASACDRFQSAIDSSGDCGDSMILALAQIGLGFFRVWRGETGEARTLLAEGLALARRIDNAWVVANSLYFLAWLHSLTGEFEAAREALREGIDISRGGNDAFVLSGQLGLLGHVAIRTGDRLQAAQVLDESIVIARERGNAMILAWSAAYRGLVAAHAGEAEVAASLLTEARDGCDASQSRWMASHVFAIAGTAEFVMGDVERARLSWAEAEAAARATACVSDLATTVRGQAWLNRASGDFARAESLEREALALAVRAGMVPDVIDSLDSLATLMAATGQASEAVRVLSAVLAARAALGSVRPAALAEVRGGDDATARGALDDAVALAGSSGAMTVDEAVAYVTRGRGTRGRPRFGWQSLTPVELDVVKLVAQGMTTPQIARKLFLSPRTVQSHLRRIFQRLGMSTRGELAAEAVRHGM